MISVSGAIDSLLPYRFSKKECAMKKNRKIVGLLLSSFLVSFALSRATAQPTKLDFAALRSSQIVVWISARPYIYSPDIKTAFAMDFPNGKLVEREIPPETFVDQVRANPPEELAPDVAFIDNYFQLEPLLKSSSVWLAWGKPRFATRGWWVIFKNTERLAQAQAFLRWLVEAPGWQPQVENNFLPAGTVKMVQDASISALHALISGDRSGLEELLDVDAARSSPGTLAKPPGKPALSPSDHAQVNDAWPRLIFGNSRIAFVLLSAVASGESFYGMRHMFFIFRNQGSGWRILYIDSDANNPFFRGKLDTVNSVPLLSAFKSRIVDDEPETQPPTAVLIDPPDLALLPRNPYRPYIDWRSEAPATADFIIESQYGQLIPSGPDWSAYSLDFAHVSRATQSFREQAPFGIGAQPHRWRIWTLGRSGAVSVSPWRTLIYSN